MHVKRTRQLNTFDFPKSIQGPVVYWMSRDQRVRDNWALFAAQKTALEKKVPLVVLFCFVPDFLEGTMRQYGFMLRGLQQIERRLQKYDIPFYFLSGVPEKVLPEFLKRHKACALYSDFSPLQTKKRWMDEVMRHVSIPVFEVDAHNLIPCWLTFSKRASSVGAFRVQLRSMLPLFLQKFPAMRRHPYVLNAPWKQYDWDALIESLAVDRSVKEVAWITPGDDEAHKALRTFLKLRTGEYRSGIDRTNASSVWKWKIMTYLHFGQLSIQKTVWSVVHAHMNSEFKAEFLDSLITYREFADHFCYFNQEYLSIRSFPEWERESLLKHACTIRHHMYTRDQMEQSLTHDSFWNRLQRELSINGRLFGDAGKYWARKILEWSSSPQVALNRALYFMERYTLTGWDTSNYYMIARAIGGSHAGRNKQEVAMFGVQKSVSQQHKEAVRDFRAYANRN